MRLVGILLAAGRGARFGGDKLLARLPAASHGVGTGTPVGAAASRHLLAAIGEVIAIVRPGDSLLRAALSGTGARVIACADAHLGMGASLACGVAAAADADGWIVALADMPWIAPATIMAVGDALASGAEMAAPSYRGERGHPVGFAKSYAKVLVALTGDEGARAVISARRWALQEIEVDDAGVLRDVDRPDDLVGAR
jgi:molybdenum cofactor cytidylyltransferase